MCGSNFPLAVFVCCISAIFRVWVLLHTKSCVGAVAPVLPVQEPLRLVSLVVSVIFFSFSCFLCEFCILPKFLFLRLLRPVSMF